MAVAVKHLAQDGFTPEGTLVYLAVADEEALGTYGAESPRRAPPRRRAGRLRHHRVRGHPAPEPVGHQAARDRGREGLPCGARSGSAARPGTARSPTAPTTRWSTAAEVVQRLAEYRPETMIHDDVAPLHHVDGLPRGDHRPAARPRTGSTACSTDLPVGWPGSSTPARTPRSPRPSSKAGRRSTSSPTRSTCRSTSAPCPARPRTTPGRSSYEALGDLAERVDVHPEPLRRVERVAHRHARCGTACSRAHAALVPRVRDGAVPHRRCHRRPVLPAHGEHRLRLRALQREPHVRGLRHHVPRRRRAHRHRSRSGCRPSSGRPSRVDLLAP